MKIVLLLYLCMFLLESMSELILNLKEHLRYLKCCLRIRGESNVLTYCLHLLDILISNAIRRTCIACTFLF